MSVLSPPKLGGVPEGGRGLLTLVGLRLLSYVYMADPSIAMRHLPYLRGVKWVWVTMYPLHWGGKWTILAFSPPKLGGAPEGGRGLSTLHV